MCIYDIIDELMNINEIKWKTSNQIFTETFHDNSMRFSAITLFYSAHYYSIKSSPLSMTFNLNTKLQLSVIQNWIYRLSNFGQNEFDFDRDPLV